jgi:hypothetical protein
MLEPMAAGPSHHAFTGIFCNSAVLREVQGIFGADFFVLATSLKNPPFCEAIPVMQIL